MCIWMYVDMFVYMYIYTYMYMCVYMCVYMNVYICIYMRMCIGVYIYVCIYMYICRCKYINMLSEIKKDGRYLQQITLCKFPYSIQFPKKIRLRNCCYKKEIRNYYWYKVKTSVRNFRKQILSCSKTVYHECMYTQ